MAIPKNVQNQVDRADKLHNEMYGDDDKGRKGKEGIPDDKKAPEKEKPPVEPVVDVAPVIPDPDVENFKQQYLVIKGKYDKEIPALRAQVEEFGEEIKRLKESPKNPESAEPENLDEAVAKLQEQYGAEFTTMINSHTDARAEAKAVEIATRIVDEKMKGMKETVNQVVNTQVGTEETRFFNAMNKGLGEGWKTGINKDPKFIAWLNKPIDPELGHETYFDKLTVAYNAFDDVKVLAIFNRYIKTNPQALADEKRKSDLETQVVPESQGGDNLPVETKGKNYSRADIDQFYKDCRTGKYDNDPAEKARIDADIIAAGAEGRVTN